MESDEKELLTQTLKTVLEMLASGISDEDEHTLQIRRGGTGTMSLEVTSRPKLMSLFIRYAEQIESASADFHNWFITAHPEYDDLVGLASCGLARWNWGSDLAWTLAHEHCGDAA